MKSPANEQNTLTIAIVVIATVMVAGVLYLMRPVVLPIILAMFFASLARPLQLKLQRFLPSSAALVLTVVLVGAMLVALPLVFAANLQVVIGKLPEYAPRLTGILKDIEGFARSAGIDLSAFDMSSDKSVQALLGIVTESLQGLVSFLGTTLLVVFTLIFILAEANGLNAKLAAALKPTNYATVQASIASIQERIQRYVTTKTLFAALNAVAAGLFTWALGIDFPALWTLLTFILYFIPNFGTLIATLPPILLALVQFESPTTAIVCLIGLVVIFNLLGNVLEPRFLGRTLSLSPLVVFISLLFWGWYFGMVGVILSVPLTVAIGIICDHIDSLRPMAALLADRPRPSPPPKVTIGERTR